MSNSCCDNEPKETSSCCASEEPAKATTSCCASDEPVQESKAEASSCCGPSTQPTPPANQTLASFLSFWRTYVMTAWSFVWLIPALVWLLDAQQWTDVMAIAVNALSGTLPYIVFAILMIAYLKATGAEHMVAKAFEGREIRMIFMAALMGGLAPFCSCEVIPFIAGLLALGAPLSAVMAFWLSSPLIDPPTLLITAGALGWQFAAAKAGAAVIMGLVGGFGVKLLMGLPSFRNPLKDTPISSCCGVGLGQGGRPHWQFWVESERIQVFKDQLVENGAFLLKWLAVAYLLEALLITYVPAALIAQVVGGEGITPVITSALVGMPAYLNSYVAPPLVAGLMEQGMSAASGMAFMLAGAISSIPAMTAVWSLVKPGVFAAYLGLGLVGAVSLGLVFGSIV